ncbi:hypothetical protein SDC9_72872 [bioreactor metagenome]|uniref:Uncharacterized protein n=1 Tax=bioreactor metagenome TaxID=1076179 RepID=A0A644YEQ5_9ZZZZ
MLGHFTQFRLIPIQNEMIDRCLVLGYAPLRFDIFFAVAVIIQMRFRDVRDDGNGRSHRLDPHQLETRQFHHDIVVCSRYTRHCRCRYADVAGFVGFPYFSARIQQFRNHRRGRGLSVRACHADQSAFEDFRCQFYLGQYGNA